jgi:hypothetical protein
MLYIENLPPGARPCAIIPGRQKDPKGFIDTGNELVGFDPHIYCSYEGVKQMALKLGFVEGEEHHSLREELTDRIHQLETELQDTQEQLSQADGYIEAVDLLESAGFRARHKPGRPKQKVAQ